MRSAAENRARAGNHVNARGNHGGRVNERGDRCRTFHRVRQPDIKWNLSRFSGCADHQQQGRCRQHSPSDFWGHALKTVEDRVKIERVKFADQQEHSQQEAEITNAVDDERLLARIGGRILEKKEANQQVRSQSHAFPANKHQQVIVGQHQRKHEEHEKVQVRKEPVEAAFMGHVANGIHVDQKTHAGHDQHHYRGKLVKIKAERRVEVPGHDPGEGKSFIVRQAEVRPLNGCAHQWQHRNDPQIEIRIVHSLSRLTRSTFSVSRVRKTAMMMARPTAASAAATTITKNTNTCPLSWCQWLAKATKLRFTPLSINSMAMKMVMMFRFSRNAETPRQNRIALRTRYQERGTIQLSLRARTTAPIMAIRISTEVISNGSRKSLNSRLATACVLSAGEETKLPMLTELNCCWFLNIIYTIKPASTATAGPPIHRAMRLPRVRSSAPAFNSMMTKTNNTMTAPA